jgi:DNA excision repair protein ERCC-2
VLSVYRIKLTDASKLQEEYVKLVEGLQEAEDARAEDAVMANPGRSCIQIESCSNVTVVLPDDLLKEAVPGNVRKAEHFVAFLKRFIEYLKVCNKIAGCRLQLTCSAQTRMRVLHVVAETPLSFLQHLKDITFIEKRPLRYAFAQFYI